MDSIEYRPGLATWELIVEVRQLLATGRRTERLVCRYLADLADRIQARQDLALARYADELHAARSYFGLGARDARERIRVGRALRQLPEVERAFVEGQLCYSRVREVTRIAVAADESEWLELARRLDMRALERRIAAARAPLLDDEASSFNARPKTRRVTFELSEPAYELLQQALESARSLSGACTDGEALERLAQVALSARTPATSIGLTQPANPDPSRASPSHTEFAPAEPTPTEPAPVELAPGEPAPTAPSRTESAHAESSRSAPFRAESSRSEPARSAPKPIRAWSWDELGWGATQGGSCESDDESLGADALDVHQREARERKAREHDHWGEVNSRLLRAMGGSGRWIPDTLIEASGLSASEVNSALTFLQLSGRIRRRADAFEPV